jgi:hypothetical protein
VSSPFHLCLPLPRSFLFLFSSYYYILLHTLPSPSLPAVIHILPFHSAPILYVRGRQHPVKIYHSLEPQADYVESAVRVFWQIHLDDPDARTDARGKERGGGDVLPGGYFFSFGLSIFFGFILLHFIFVIFFYCVGRERHTAPPRGRIYPPPDT